MRFRAPRFLTAFSLLAFLALPAWAHTDSATLAVSSPTTIAGTHLKPGTYKLEVEPNQTQLKIVNTDSDKTVGQVPCQWFVLKKAPRATQVMVNSNTVTEIDFGGKTEAIRIG